MAVISRILLLSVMSVCLSGGLYAQKPLILPKHVIDSLAASREVRSELLTFDALVVDLGEIADDGVLRTCEFAFENGTADTVKINRVTTSCGCLSYTLAEKVFPPGSKGRLVARYDPSNRIGPFEQRINLYSGEGFSPDAVLKVKGKVSPEHVSANYRHAMGNLRMSRKEIDFGEVSSNQSREESIICVNAGTEPVSLRPFAPMTLDCITFRTIPEVIGPGCEAELVIGIIADKIPEKTGDEYRLTLILDGVDAIPSDRSIQLRFVYKKEKSF